MKNTTLLCAALLTIGLTACGGGANVKKSLGLQPTPPDEFSVVSRAPLSVPPDYTLRPPRPGEGRPMEVSVREKTRQTVFGAADRVKVPEAASTTSSSIMSKLGADQTNPSLRTELDAEVRAMEKAEQPAAEKLLFWKEKEPLGKTIDPVAEQKRLESAVEKRTEDVLTTQ